MLQELFGIDIVWSIVIIAISSGIWAIWGGMKSIAYMDLLTIIIMVFGGLSVTYLGLLHLGQGEGLIAGVKEMIQVNAGKAEWSKQWIAEHAPHVINGRSSAEGYDRLLVLQPYKHNLTSWVHWIFSFFYIGLWYTAINQHMIQKVLAAKDMYHARMGMVFACMLKLLLPFFVVFPGMIFFAMNPELLHPTPEQLSEMNPKIMAEGDAAKISKLAFKYSSDAANKTYILMIKELVPIALMGILLAALFGAIQSTVCSVLNSTSTVFTLDFYKRFRRQQVSESEEVLVGRVAGAVGLTLGILIAILLAKVTRVNLFWFIQMLYVFFAPPFSATFLLGTLWRQVSGADALLATVVSLVFAGVLKILEYYGQLPGWMMPFVMQGLLVWSVCMIVLILSALSTPPPRPEQVTSELTLDWSKLNFGEGLGTTWYDSVTLWWAISVVLMIGFVVLFSIVL